MIEPLYQSRAPVAFEKPYSPVQRARKLDRGRQQVGRRGVNKRVSKPIGPIRGGYEYGIAAAVKYDMISMSYLLLTGSSSPLRGAWSLGWSWILRASAADLQMPGAATATAHELTYFSTVFGTSFAKSWKMILRQ